jgi:ankyrin repeat protein
LQAGADVNMQDSDGWTALHAAAHWSQKEACQLLVDNLSDMEIKNFVVSTCQLAKKLELTLWVNGRVKRPRT